MVVSVKVKKMGTLDFAGTHPPCGLNPSKSCLGSLKNCLKEKIKFKKLTFDQIGSDPKLAFRILKFVNPFFILMDTKHLKWILVFKIIFFSSSSLPSLLYYPQSQNCTIPTII